MAVVGLGSGCQVIKALVGGAGGEQTSIPPHFSTIAIEEDGEGLLQMQATYSAHRHQQAAADSISTVWKIGRAENVDAWLDHQLEQIVANTAAGAKEDANSSSGAGDPEVLFICGTEGDYTWLKMAARMAKEARRRRGLNVPLLLSHDFTGDNISVNEHLQSIGKTIEAAGGFSQIFLLGNRDQRWADIAPSVRRDLWRDFVVDRCWCPSTGLRAAFSQRCWVDDDRSPLEFLYTFTTSTVPFDMEDLIYRLKRREWDRALGAQRWDGAPQPAPATADVQVTELLKEAVDGVAIAHPESSRAGGLSAVGANAQPQPITAARLKEIVDRVRQWHVAQLRSLLAPPKPDFAAARAALDRASETIQRTLERLTITEMRLDRFNKQDDLIRPLRPERYERREHVETNWVILVFGLLVSAGLGIFGISIPLWPLFIIGVIAAVIAAMAAAAFPRKVVDVTPIPGQPYHLPPYDVPLIQFPQGLLGDLHMELVQSTGRLDKLRRRWAAAIADNVNPAGVPAQLSDDMLAQVRASARPESMEAFQSSVKALCEKAYEAVMGEIDAVELFEEQEHLLESGFSFLRHWTFEELLSVAPASLFEERGRRAVENQPLLAPIPPTILQDGPFVVAVQSPPLLSTNLTPPTERYVRFYRFHGSVHVHNE